MYHPPGEYVTDFCIVHSKIDGLYHLFHIRGERWTWPVGYREIDLGHAVSSDLRLWTPQEPVLPAGPPGSWDEAGNWAPDIIEVGGVYYLYYTGSDARNNQKIGLAISTDLYTWHKHPHNPVVEPGPWSDRAVGRDVAGRDAMVYADTERNRYLMYYTATMADGRACIALAQSQDLIRWEDMGPAYIEEDRTYNRCESAYLVRRDHRYYLFYSAKGGPKSKGFSPQAFDHFDIVYLVSDDPTGNWVKPHNHQLLEGWSCASEHPTFDGATYMFYIIQEEINGIWGASSLSDPKRLVWLADGTVQIQEYIPDNVERCLLFSGEMDGYDGWVSQGGVWQPAAEGLLSAATGIEDGYLTHTLWGADLALEAELRTEAASIGSLIVRGNPSAFAGYRVSLDYDRQVVGFYLRFPGEPDRLIQERPVALKAGQWHLLKVVVQGDFFDIYVDGGLYIVHHQRIYDSGCFGLHARGSVQFRNVRADRYIDPEGAVADWNSHCRPRHLFPAG
jgi:beta-fructofuranosidase